jgi:hypothetical protein
MVTTVTTTNDASTAGTSGSDVLYAAAGGNPAFFGGAGNDAFVIKATSLTNTLDGLSYKNTIGADAAILDFSGAGGWNSTNNDFLALTGFGVGSTLSFSHYGTAGNTTQFYTVHDTTTNADYTIYIHSVSGKLLGAGDYNFYASV